MPRALSLAAVLLAVWATPARAQKEITLYPGEQRVLDVTALQRIAVGNPSVVEATTLADGREVLLVGRGEGRTNIILWNIEGRQQTIYVNVVPAHLSKSAEAMRDLLKDVKGAEVKVVGGMLTVKGQVATNEDFERVQKAAQMYGATNLIDPPSTQIPPEEIVEQRLKALEQEQMKKDPRVEGAEPPKKRKLPPIQLKKKHYRDDPPDRRR